MQVVDVYNMALGHLGIGKTVGSITERSREAIACTTYYETVRDEVLTDVDWPWATKRATLELVLEEPNDDWLYAYRYPVNCKKLLKIPNGCTRDDNMDTLVRYVIQDHATEGKLIYTDQEEAEAIFISEMDNPNVWPAAHAMNVSLRLASFVGGVVGGADAVKMADRAGAKYEAYKRKARIDAANEQPQPQDQLPESIRARL